MQLHELILILTGGAAVVLFWRRIELHRIEGELERIRSSLNSQGGPVLPPGCFNLRSKAARLAASSVSMLLVRLHEAQRGSADFSRLVLISQRIAAGEENAEELADLALQLLMEHGGPDVAGGILFRRSSEPVESGCACGSWQPVGVSGAPPLQRLCGVLQIVLDRLLFVHVQPQEQGTPDLGWGYVMPRPGDELDLSVLGIGVSLFVPLMHGNCISGALWLGFRFGSTGLDRQKQKLLLALAGHLSAAFESAEHTLKRSARTVQERDFLIGLSHDLRSPSAVALLAVQDLQFEHSNSAILPHRLRTIEHCLRDQLTMLDDVIDLSRHRFGLIKAQPAIIDWRQIEEIVADFAPLAADKGLKLQICPGWQNQTAKADTNHFRRIIHNLISNAIKYTDIGEVTVNIYPFADRLIISVADSGCGIAADERALLFRPFSRLENSRGREGNGIGLVISRILAELNGGKLEYAPGCAGGSVFTLSLERGPEGIGSEESGSGRESGDAAGGIMKSESAPRIAVLGRQTFQTAPRGLIQTGSYETALVVDDDHGVCRLVCRILNGRAKKVVIANNLSQAMAIAKAEPPDLIISDYLLGDGTAADLFSFLDQIDSGASKNGWRSRTRAVILSGGSLIPEFEEQQSGSGCIRFLQKPVSSEQLLSAIR